MSLCTGSFEKLSSLKCRMSSSRLLRFRLFDDRKNCRSQLISLFLYSCRLSFFLEENNYPSGCSRGTPGQLVRHGLILLILRPLDTRRNIHYDLRCSRWTRTSCGCCLCFPYRFLLTLHGHCPPWELYSLYCSRPFSSSAFLKLSRITQGRRTHLQKRHWPN